jgi:hypothetical protein
MGNVLNEIKNYELIVCDNEYIMFKFDGVQYSVERQQIEEAFPSIYWFMADLFEEIIRLFKENKDWFSKYIFQ